MIEQLIDIIGREARLFESFLTLLEKQQAALVQSDLAFLNQITEQQRAKVNESQQLSQQRQELIDAIRHEKQIDGDLNVSRLLGLVDSDQAARLQTLQTLILELDQKINEVRNQNALLVNRSREYIRRMMQMLSQSGRPSAMYAANGENAASDNAVLVDGRI